MGTGGVLGGAAGSRGYLSPEQAQGLEIDCRSDIYSLGCTLHFLLSGKAPSTSDEPGTVSPGLASLLNKMTALDPENRFGTMQELVTAIDDPKLSCQTSAWKKAALFFVLAAVALFSGVALRSSGLLERHERQRPEPSGIVEQVETPPTLDEEPWMTTKEIASHLSVHENTVYRWIDSQGMPAHRAGRAWRFKKSEVDAWFKMQDKKK